MGWESEKCDITTVEAGDRRLPSNGTLVISERSDEFTIFVISSLHCRLQAMKIEIKP